MRPLAAILCVLIAAAGWHYTFYSRAAGKLGVIEAEPVNRLRRRLRRAGGVVMMALAVCMGGGFFSVEWNPSTPQGARRFVLVWSAALALLALVILFGLVDLMLTLKLRRDREHRSERRPTNESTEP